MDQNWKISFWQNNSYQTNDLSNLVSLGAIDYTTNQPWTWSQGDSDLDHSTHGLDAKIEDLIDFNGNGSYSDTGETKFTVHMYTYIYVEEIFLLGGNPEWGSVYFDQQGTLYINKVDDADGSWLTDPHLPPATVDCTFSNSCSFSYMFDSVGWYRIDIVYNNNMGGDRVRVKVRLPSLLSQGRISAGGTYVSNLGTHESVRSPDYGLEWTTPHNKTLYHTMRNSRILFAGTGTPPNPNNGEILLNLQGLGYPFSENIGLVLTRCAPVKYQIDNYTSNAATSNSFDLNGNVGANSHPSDDTFDLSHIFSQAIFYNDNYIQADLVPTTGANNNAFNGGWDEVRADFAPIVVYYG